MRSTPVTTWLENLEEQRDFNCRHSPPRFTIQKLLRAARLACCTSAHTSVVSFSDSVCAIQAVEAGEKFLAETRAHDDLNLWPDVEDPATQHAMCARIVQILEAFKRLHKKTVKDYPMLKNGK